MGNQTLQLPNRPVILAEAAVVGQKEGEGPLRHGFDQIAEDPYLGQDSWEKAETELLRRCFSAVCGKAALRPEKLNYVFAGDLLNQCVSSAFAMRDKQIPYFGLYGACSTMVEALSLAAIMLDGGYAQKVCALTGSHFCSAERQYRFPLEYGGQRPPCSQWTVTGAGAMILGLDGTGPRITHLTTGQIVDAGMDDANHMGAAMAPAAYHTLQAHFRDTGRSPEYYDAIFTGDLGALGHDLLEELFAREGIHLGPRYMDCGVLIYDTRTQDVHAGGSGCGCCASVLGGHILPAMRRGVWKRVLVAATGALMSPVSSQQRCTIPGISHAISLEMEG